MPSKYHPVGDEKFHDVSPTRASLSESFTSTLLEQEDDARSQEPRRFTVRWMWLAHALLLSLSFCLFVSAYFTRVSTLAYVQHYSAWSPAAKAVEYVDVWYNDTMGINSPYVGKGPAVDAAWDKISFDMGDTFITKDQIKIIDMPETSLTVKNPKTGEEGYRVGLEVFHQLHCLNVLRQVTYRDWYEDISGEFGKGAEDLKMHTDHCLEILRLNIMCTADIGVFTLYMIDDDPLPWPELNSHHVCRNFDAIIDWAMENSVGTMERPDFHPLTETVGNATSDHHIHE